MENKVFDVVPYSPTAKAEWDKAAAGARQRAFLFRRDYMDYHADRFRDVSLMLYDGKGRLRGLFPANVSNTVARRVESHGGLTYGGLLTAEDCGTADCMAMLDAAAAHFARAGFTSLLYKCVPHIYHDTPAEEDLYWFFRHGAQLSVRNVSTVVTLAAEPHYSTLRRRKMHRAERLTPPLRMVTGAEWLPAYWAALEEVLRKRHNAKPVHTLAEITRLAALFPEDIQLYAAIQTGSDATSGETGTGSRDTLLAGCLVYRTPLVAHLQYIACTDAGYDRCALDWLTDRLAESERKRPHPARYLDFGTSNEDGGRVLNEGLIFQKEGFGARAVCYDQYLVPLA